MSPEYEDVVIDGVEWEIVTDRPDDGGGNPGYFRQRWLTDAQPGERGSGVKYVATHFTWHLANDNVWEKTILEWRLAGENEGYIGKGGEPDNS